MKSFLTHNIFNLSNAVSNFTIRKFTVTNRTSPLFGGLSYTKINVPFFVLKNIKLISLLENGIYTGVAGGLATGILYTSNYLITANAIALSHESILTFYIENPELFTSSCG